jgi:hypothetical protein
MLKFACFRLQRPYSVDFYLENAYRKPPVFQKNVMEAGYDMHIGEINANMREAQTENSNYREEKLENKF